MSCIPRLQWRDRSGIPPDSLLSPVWGTLFHMDIQFSRTGKNVLYQGRSKRNRGRWLEATNYSYCKCFHAFKQDLAVLKRLFLKLPEQQTGLDSGIILVFTAAISVVISLDGMIVNLADGHPGVDPNRLDTKDLKGPVSAKTNIAETCRDMNEKTQPADGGTTLQHRDQPVGLGVFEGPSQIEPVGLKYQSLRRNDELPGGVFLFHIEE